MKPEKELIQLLNKGDEEAIRIIFDTFYDELCLYAAGFTKSFQVAEEVVEDVFISLWKNATNLSITTSLKSYLYKSVYNGCLKFLKTEGRLNSSTVENDSEIFKTSSFNDPESELILQELEKKADLIMESLPAQCKEIYFLSRFENLSYSQIAEKLKITTGTVKTQMSRAFHKFKAEFGEFLR